MSEETAEQLKETLRLATDNSIKFLGAVRDREAGAVVDKYKELDEALAARARETEEYIARQYATFLEAIQELDRLATDHIHHEMDQAIKAIRSERDRGMGAVRDTTDEGMVSLKTAAENALAIIES